MIYGNHDKRKGDIVKVARWDDQALLMIAWQRGIRSNSGPQRRAVCEAMAERSFLIVNIDYYARLIFLVMVSDRTHTILEDQRVHVEMDNTNLIRVGRLGEKE